MDRFSIGKINISKVNLHRALTFIEDSVANHRLGYICITNSRVVYYANHDENYCKIQNNSLLTTPDGMPLVWMAHNMGHQEVGRVCGPDLFSAILDLSEKHGYSHYFYGSTQKTIDQILSKLKDQYPSIIVKGAVSPPYQPIERFDINSLAEEINQLKPTFFWCGLGAPKQELLMSMLQPQLNGTICIGVGLVFDYFAGNVKRAPSIFQQLGMEWLVRSIQQPNVFLKRMVKPFFWTLAQLILSFFHKS